jgi:hypothetical protein
MNSATRPSDVNDLEEHLQQNMKLRCELGAEVAKALTNNSSGNSRQRLHSAGGSTASDSDDLEELRRELKARLTK